MRAHGSTKLLFDSGAQSTAPFRLIGIFRYFSLSHYLAFGSCTYVQYSLQTDDYTYDEYYMNILLIIVMQYCDIISMRWMIYTEIWMHMREVWLIRNYNLSCMYFWMCDLMWTWQLLISVVFSFYLFNCTLQYQNITSKYQWRYLVPLCI